MVLEPPNAHFNLSRPHYVTCCPAEAPRTNRDLLTMASAPSASALSAVLRCRGNIWTRNPPTKRPASAAYSLGLAGGKLRDSPAERSGSSRGSEWRIPPRGERLVSAGGLSVSCRWDSGENDAPGGEDLRKKDKLSISNLSQSWLCAAPGGHYAPLQQLLLSLSSALQEGDRFSRIIHLILPEASDAQRISVQGISHFPAGVLKLSVCVPSRLKVQNPSSPLASLLSWLIFSKRQTKSISTDPPQVSFGAHFHINAHRSCSVVRLKSKSVHRLSGKTRKSTRAAAFLAER